MTRILAADIGGTKTLLQLSEFAGGEFRVLAEQRFASVDYQHFDMLLNEFLEQLDGPAPEHSCFAVAGPISDRGSRAKVTNLPWLLERDRLSDRFDLGRLTLINDFHAVAVGIDSLRQDEWITLQQGRPQPQTAQLVIGAGTGLGVAQRIWQGDRYQILASEAGHAGFAPGGQLQLELLAFLAAENPLVSREQILSGSGLVNIYRFLCHYHGHRCRELDAAEISRLASAVSDSDSKICAAAMALFFESYGSECGNLALATLPYAGIFIAGGIAAKNIALLQSSAFVSAFNHKSKMQAILATLPIHVISNEAVGLQGARLQASRGC